MQGFTQYPTHYPVPEPPHRSRTRLIVTAVIVAVAIIGLGGGYVGYRIVTGVLAARQRPASATSPTTVPSTVEPTEPTEPEPAPSAVGMVDVSAVADQGQAVPVAEMFSAYFGGIDSGDTAQALREYDPAGVVDAADPDQASQFAHAVSTTDDTDVSLVGLDSDPTGRGAVRARVLFTSHQSAGYGPSTDPDQTCTRWDVTYVLTYDQTAGYRILDNSRHASSAC